MQYSFTLMLPSCDDVPRPSGHAVSYIFGQTSILCIRKYTAFSCYEQDNMVLGPLLNDKVDVLEQLESPGVT